MASATPRKSSRPAGNRRAPKASQTAKRSLYRVVRPMGGSGGTYIKRSQRLLAVEYLVTLASSVSFAFYNGEVPNPAMVIPATLVFSMLGVGTEFSSTQQLAVLFGGLVAMGRLMTPGSVKGSPPVSGAKALFGMVQNLEGWAATTPLVKVPSNVFGGKKS